MKSGNLTLGLLLTKLVKYKMNFVKHALQNSLQILGTPEFYIIEKYFLPEARFSSNLLV
jgi:hypothetical protein